jgi:hypothetical protein
MNKLAWVAICAALTAGVGFFSSALAGQECTAPAMSPAASALASRYLKTTEKCLSFPSVGGRRGFVLIGESRPHGWRVLVVADDATPRVLWDSVTLHDPYIQVMAPDNLDCWGDGAGGVIITMRGCAPHQCADGKIGFALYSSERNQVYVSHVTTRDDGSYEVTYYPKSGIPDAYRSELDQMMCSDNGISRPSTLPINCGTRVR